MNHRGFKIFRKVPKTKRIEDQKNLRDLEVFIGLSNQERRTSEGYGISITLEDLSSPLAF